MKKFFALVLALVMALSLTTVAWGAEVSIWDGVVPTVIPDTLVVDDDTNTVYVKDAAAFAYLSTLSAKWAEMYTDGLGTEYGNYANGEGADYYYSSYWTVSLETDIDLNNHQIAPVLIKFGQSTGASHFDGKGCTIKNAVIKTDSTTENGAGLFANSRCDFKNLKLDNIQVTGSNKGNSTAGVLAGDCNFAIANITITNSSVTGGKYTGGVVGYGYTNITGCTLTNVTVKGGYKLGGLIGYICASGGNTANVTGNTLTDCTVDGIGGGIFAGGKTEYKVGMLVGNYNADGDCGGNAVTDMTTSATEMIGEVEANITVNESSANTESTTPPAPTPTPTPVYPYYPPVVEDTTDKDVTSAQTFDAGIALYVGVSVLGAAGTVALSKKRED